MIFGMLAIGCWFILFCAIVALPIVMVRRQRLSAGLIGAFLIAAVLAGAAVFRAARPAGFATWESLNAGLTAEGLRKYGHPIEHQAEVAICLASYAAVAAGAVSAALMRVAATRVGGPFARA